MTSSPSPASDRRNAHHDRHEARLRALDQGEGEPAEGDAMATRAGDLDRPGRVGQVLVASPDERQHDGDHAAAGRLMKKIQRHDAYSTSRPPSGGPISVPMPLQAVHWPTARPLSSP